MFKVLNRENFFTYCVGLGELEVSKGAFKTLLWAVA